ncbi:sugar-tranasporter [Hirsutella rhossiliensis]|uniref:Molybdate-anion transporter n=1 Tax=Hirsutella rhossiliensis TaxID=111463 RepID=A0A9P8MXB4_9HYPO|nr:sugar-tranasporter [Hirsutella rhossiliensis]KAH0964028.1 sugar-tranasporter [Hirsutella rhossiliensis]
MDFYTTTLAALCGLCAVLVYHKHGFRDAKDANSARQATACQFQRRFLFVYALAVGADWLQGPHLYAWYRYDKQLPEELVALMYATGFAAGAVSAAVAGPLMDCLGPDLGCLAYSLFASTSCGLIESDKPSRLLLGRVCGGFATTFLFSAFESWMVTKYHTLGLDDSTLPLGTVLSNMTLADTEGELPLGLIFASFMCAMMIGSTVASGPLMTFSGQSATRDLIIAMLVACGSLSCAVLLDSERMLFGVFCILEASIGAYFPVMGYLKGEHVDDKDRNLVYSIFRLPLNTLVLVAHCLDTEGDEHRDRVFLTLAGMLLAASLVVKQSLAS